MPGRWRQVVVLGFDGVDPGHIARLMRQGRVPGFSMLRDKGSVGSVETTWPAQTPVAWSTFATGTNPGGHGIFDFLRPNRSTYAAELGLVSFEQRSRLLPPVAINQRGGVPFWEQIAHHGLPATVIRCPCTFPPDASGAEIISGMGVPDIRGGIGTATVFTTSGESDPADHETVVRLRELSDGWVGDLPGPRRVGAEDSRTTLHFALTEGGVRIAAEGASPVTQRVGEWGPHIPVRFRVGPLSVVRGQVRLCVLAVAPELTVYALPVNFDPSAPLFPMSAPTDYARSLMKRVGRFATSGMIEDHAGFGAGRLSAPSFLQHCSLTMEERERMLMDALDRHNAGLVFCLFDTPDRVQHMFWRGARSGELAAVEAIDECVLACDRVVQRVLDRVGPETLVIALSDHGFTSFDRQFHINAWLREAGLLTLKGDGDELSDVDWSRTRAFAVGIGSVYLNVRGREAQGIVDAAEVPTLAASIARSLCGVRDEEKGAVAVTTARAADDLYHGPYRHRAPDVIVGCAPGYRASWRTAVGGVPPICFEDNTQPWSGDHIVDPASVPGVLAMNAPATRDAKLVDLAPTILHALNVPASTSLEGRVLL